MLKMLRLVPLFVIVVACVDPINIDSHVPASIVIIDGYITDDPGPYVVKIIHAFALEANASQSKPVKGAKIVLYSDKGESEDLVEGEIGTYETGGKIHGTIGNSYHITIQMPDGSTLQSEPELLNANGDIKSIHYIYEHRTTTKPWGVIDADVFNVFVDADTKIAEGGLSYMRWRFTGTYKTETFPQLHKSTLQGYTFLDPWPCSGYVVDPAPGGGILRQDTVCTCCTCWVDQYESIPRLSDSELVSDGQFRNVKVGEVPITRATFIEKYRVAIEQLAITKNAFEFFKVIRNQKENTTNLFQPPPGRNVGNVTKSVDGDYDVVGLFWAASVRRDAIFITKDDVPYKLAVDSIPLPCTYLANSSTSEPDFWK